jgi:hypothetical protein
MIIKCRKYTFIFSFSHAQQKTHDFDMLHPSTPERVSAIQIDQSLTRLPRTPEHSKPSLPTISELASKLRRDREIAKTRRLIRRQDNEEILPESAENH